jgi:recombination protein RecT
MNEIATVSSVGSAPAKQDKQPKVMEYLRSPLFMEEARKLLGSRELAERLARVAVTCISSDSKLGQCNAQSLVRTVLRLAEIGLEPGRDAYLIPYGQDCQAIIRWEGYVRAARMSGEIKRVWSSVIREGDTYKIRAGSASPSIEHEWDLTTKRGDVIGAYACAEWTDGTVEIEIVDRDYLDRCRKAAGGKGQAWGQWFDQMARKSVVKRLCQRLPLGAPARPETASVIETIDAEPLPEDGPTFIEPEPVALPAAEAKRTRKPRQPKEEPAETPALMTDAQHAAVVDYCQEHGLSSAEVDAIIPAAVDGTCERLEDLSEAGARKLLAILGEPELVAQWRETIKQ